VKGSRKAEVWINGDDTATQDTVPRDVPTFLSRRRLVTNAVPRDSVKAAYDSFFPLKKCLLPFRYLGPLRIPPERWLLEAGLNSPRRLQVPLAVRSHSSLSFNLAEYENCEVDHQLTCAVFFSFLGDSVIIFCDYP
jgi:hypothetical protein